MIAQATLVGNGVGVALPAEVKRGGDVCAELPRTRPPRSVVVGRRADPQPGDTPYVAFIYFTEHADHVDFMADRTRDMSPAQRVLYAIRTIGSHDDPEPEAPTEVVTLDGATVVAVDLSRVMPGYTLYVNERLIP